MDCARSEPSVERQAARSYRKIVLWSPVYNGGSGPSRYSFIPNRIGMSCAA
jgi:hypothetical protein